jgi:hypothetical protein
MVMKQSGFCQQINMFWNCSNCKKLYHSKIIFFSCEADKILSFENSPGDSQKKLLLRRMIRVKMKRRMNHSFLHCKP